MVDHANSRREIRNVEDITILLQRFYERARQDSLLGPVFYSQIKNWDEHVSMTAQFWMNLLFRGKGLDEGLDAKHSELFIQSRHFDRWITIFHDVVNTHYDGPVAQHAKFLSIKLAELCRSKLNLTRF